MNLARYKWYRKLQCMLGYKHILRLAPVPKSLQNIMSKTVMSTPIKNNLEELERFLLKN
jgi:hypothetical protein